jgi:mRNA interferase RelE/StbE
MTYRLRFHELALVEWRKRDGSLRGLFKKKLEERLDNPRVPAAALAGMPDCFKIKLRSAGYRLVYRVDDDVVFITVIAVGRRDRNQVYRQAQARLDE